MRVWFDQADADHDGALTRGEFRQDALRFFRTLDVNDDGVIGPGEMKRYEQSVFPELAYGDHPPPIAALHMDVMRIAYAGQFSSGGGQQQQQGGGRGGGRSASGEDRDASEAPRGPRGVSSLGAGAYGLLAEPEPVTAADLNFDGRVTEVEFATRADQRFDTLDTAQTGQLTYADLQSRMPKVRGGRRRGSPRT